MAAAKHAAQEDSRDAWRASVLDAARTVFERSGLDGASIRLIAREAGCTTGSIYPYFKGKEEIYAEVLSRSLREYVDVLTSDMARKRDATQRFDAALRSHFKFYETRPGDLSLALYLFNGLKPQGLSRELDARLNAQLAGIHAIFTDSVRAFTRLDASGADLEIGLHFAFLFGLLMLHHTRRTRAFRINARRLLEEHIGRSLLRLQTNA